MSNGEKRHGDVVDSDVTFVPFVGSLCGMVPVKKETVIHSTPSTKKLVFSFSIEVKAQSTIFDHTRTPPTTDDRRPTTRPGTITWQSIATWRGPIRWVIDVLQLWGNRKKSEPTVSPVLLKSCVISAHWSQKWSKQPRHHKCSWRQFQRSQVSGFKRS